MKLINMQSLQNTSYPVLDNIVKIEEAPDLNVIRQGSNQNKCDSLADSVTTADFQRENKESPDFHRKKLNEKRSQYKRNLLELEEFKKV
jgi:hypothetical protein